MSRSEGKASGILLPKDTAPATTGAAMAFRKMFTIEIETDIVPKKTDLSKHFRL